MTRVSIALATAALAAGILLSPAIGAERAHDPLRFFEGSTESISSIKVMMSKPYRTRAMGVGHIRSDGSLDLVQKVERDGHPTKIRHWVIRRTSPGHFTGTMNEAVGPIDIDEVDGNFRFKFKMKGGLAVEQWLEPRPDWRSAGNRLTVRRFGIKVGSSEGYIRKIG